MSDSSERWLARQRRDPYVREARDTGYRSRAAFKLEEIDRRCSLFRNGQRVLDLGAAPGSWAQYAVTRIGRNGVVVACDLLEIAPLERVHIIQGDARDEAVQQRIRDAVSGAALDLVICDMAPNLSGVRVRDQAEAMELVDVALELSGALLRADPSGTSGGAMVVKLFQGEGSEAWLATVRKCFGTVRVLKPKASRDESREVYVVAQRFKGYAVPGMPECEDGADAVDDA